MKKLKQESENVVSNVKDQALGDLNPRETFNNKSGNLNAKGKMKSKVDILEAPNNVIKHHEMNSSD